SVSLAPASMSCAATPALSLSQSSRSSCKSSSVSLVGSGPSPSPRLPSCRRITVTLRTPLAARFCRSIRCSTGRDSYRNKCPASPSILLRNTACAPTPAPTSSIVDPGRTIRASRSSCGCRYSPYQPIASPTIGSSGKYCSIPTRVSATALSPGRWPALSCAGLVHGSELLLTAFALAFAGSTAGPSRTRSSSAAFTRVTTSLQSSRRVCRNSRSVGYHGLSSRPSSQRKSAGCATITHTGLPSAPARCATAVSTQMTRSSWLTTAAVSLKSSSSPPTSTQSTPAGTIPAVAAAPFCNDTNCTPATSSTGFSTDNSIERNRSRECVGLPAQESPTLICPD